MLEIRREKGEIFFWRRCRLKAKNIKNNSVLKIWENRMNKYIHIPKNIYNVYSNLNSATYKQCDLETFLIL